MALRRTIWTIVLACLPLFYQAMAEANVRRLQFDFFGDSILLQPPSAFDIPFDGPLSNESIQAFYDQLNTSAYQPLIASLQAYRKTHQLDDWFYYQLIRRTAQQIAPKAENYHRYTLYKWFLLSKSGFDARLAISGDVLLFSVYSKDEVFGIPFFDQDGKRYVCLNIHDYAQAMAEAAKPMAVDLQVPGATEAFSYRVTRIPDFRADSYQEKDLSFHYGNETYSFAVKVNPQIRQVFANYPALDVASYFNIPMSPTTYQSLLPALRKQVQHLKVQQGVDYLMNFTRHAFIYQQDEQVFGKEKRMGPEETLMYDQSDCDDRAALFFYLVKEIYNLPMVALMYPTHINIAIQFDKPIGQTVWYNGHQYSICEPTPQGADLAIGQLSPALRHSNYQVVYAYEPYK